MNMLYEVSERAPEAPAARCCHSQLIPIFVQHQQKGLCCGLPTLQRLSPHPSVFTLNYKEKSVPGAEEWHRQVGVCATQHQPCPGAMPTALSRKTAPANSSSCLRHQLSKKSQGKIHLGVADPIPAPGHGCPQGLCIYAC